jgi:hypothetical protein
MRINSIDALLKEQKKREAEIFNFIQLLRRNEVQNMLDRYNAEMQHQQIKMCEKDN